MDGAGKSTQIEFLAEWLRAQGRPTDVIWSRGGYTPILQWLKKVVRRVSGGKVLPAAGPSAERTQRLQHGWVRRMWLRLAIADLALLYGVWIRWRIALGNTVVADRYLADTQLDFELNFPQEQVERWRSWRWLCRLAPRPRLAFLMVISLEEALTRSAAKSEPFPDPPEQMAFRRNRYVSWSDDPAWYLLDGAESREALAEEIRAAVAHLESSHSIHQPSP